TIGWLLGSPTRTPTTLSSRTAASVSSLAPAPSLLPRYTCGSPCAVCGPGRIAGSLVPQRVPQTDAYQGRVQLLGQRGQLADQLRGAGPGRGRGLPGHRRDQLGEQSHFAIRGGPVRAQVPRLQPVLGELRGHPGHGKRVGVVAA